MAPLGISRSERGSDDLFEETRFAVGARAEAAQIARADAVAGQPKASADDLDVALWIDPLAVLDAWLENPEVLQLPDELPGRTGALAKRLHVDLVLGGAEPAPSGALTIARAAR